MTEVGLALPFAEEERLAAEAARHGHRVALRCSGADELASRVAAAPPELVLVAADPRYLTARLIEVCDRAGVRMVVVAEPGGERWARSLGVVDAVAGPARWELLEDPTRVPRPREESGSGAAPNGVGEAERGAGEREADERGAAPGRSRGTRSRWSLLRRGGGRRAEAGADGQENHADAAGARGVPGGRRAAYGSGSGSGGAASARASSHDQFAPEEGFSRAAYSDTAFSVRCSPARRSPADHPTATTPRGRRAASILAPEPALAPAPIRASRPRLPRYGAPPP